MRYVSKHEYIRWLLTALISGILVGIVSNACNPYAIAWRSTAGVRTAAEAADKTIAMVHRAKRDKCKAEAKDQAAFRECILKSGQYKALVAWNRYSKPAINTALIATVSGISLAEKNKESKLDWMSILRPAVCALTKALDQWQHLFPPSQAKAIWGVLSIVGKATCDD